MDDFARSERSTDHALRDDDMLQFPNAPSGDHLDDSVATPIQAYCPNWKPFAYG